MNYCRIYFPWYSYVGGFMKYLFLLFVIHLTACSPKLNEEQATRLRTMMMDVDSLPPSPTNHVADLPAAVELGRALFFDTRMSMDESISCASCHDAEEGWSDSRSVSLGVEDREGDRHSMPVQAAAFQKFWFWDGRADSLWSQAIKAIESHPEMDFTRMEVTHFIVEHYSDAYENIFGPLPSFEGFPNRARPGLDTWETLSSEEQQSVELVFANVGKVIEAYERQLLCADTRFDQWARGELDMTTTEEAGAVIFIEERCIDCHSGSSFSDGAFHNIGIGSGTSTPDYGRSDGMTLLWDDIFSGMGPYSDDVDFGMQKLIEMEAETATVGAFRTPSLRGVAQRHSFGHRGHIKSLERFMARVYDDARLESSAVGKLDPLVRGIDLDEPDTMSVFLRMLDCPPVSDKLGTPLD